MEERLLLRAHFIEGATARDVARLTGASSPGRVYGRVHALLSRLRDALRRAELGPEDLERLFDWLSTLGPAAPGTRGGAR